VYDLTTGDAKNLRGHNPAVPLAAGDRLGPYELLAPLRDRRHGRGLQGTQFPL